MTVADNKSLNLAFAWGLMLLVSDLPAVVCKAVTGRIPGWLPWGKVGLLGAALAACFLWKKLRALKPYAFVLFVLFTALRFSDLIGSAVWWQGRFGGEHVSFTRGYVGLYLLDTAVALAVIAALMILKRRRSECFLVKGDLAAPIGPVRWLGIRRGESWRTFGWIFAVCCAAAVAIPTLLLARFTPGAPGRAAALLPAVLAFAGINAFNEEVYFRTSFLSTLKDVVGGKQAIMIAAVFFGMSHYLYGSPSGVVGFLMTAFLGWILGKGMLETRGLFWPWLIHFVADVVVFLSYALTWVPR
jgi:membrane protease YdiL (CAAX protease family)